MPVNHELIFFYGMLIGAVIGIGLGYPWIESTISYGLFGAIIGISASAVLYYPIYQHNL